MRDINEVASNSDLCVDNWLNGNRADAARQWLALDSAGDQDVVLDAILEDNADDLGAFIRAIARAAAEAQQGKAQASAEAETPWALGSREAIRRADE